MIGGMSKIVPPSIEAAAFSCPHCGAYTTQTWYDLHTEAIEIPQRTPIVWDLERRKKLFEGSSVEPEVQLRMMLLIDKIMRGQPFIEADSSRSLRDPVYNVHLSKCYHCEQLAVWVHDRMVFPAAREGVAANQDLPEALVRDYDEARSIVNLSPRGAAALLRLVIQKLCTELGEKGKNINEDIGNLVVKGLDQMVQEALDVVRVVGNDAVHPGKIDLRDDRETALRLFELVNIIVTQTISSKKAVRAMYEMLPEGKRAEIDKRDEKALKGKDAVESPQAGETKVQGKPEDRPCASAQDIGD